MTIFAAGLLEFTGKYDFSPFIYVCFLIKVSAYLLDEGTFKLIRKCIDGKEFSGTKRYFGDLGKTVSCIFLLIFLFMVDLQLSMTLQRMFHMQFKSAGSNILFAAVTEISDSVLKGAEASGLNGMVRTSYLIALQIL